MLKSNKISNISLAVLFAMILFLTVHVDARPLKPAAIKLKCNELKIVFSDNEPGPLKLALNAFMKDLKNVMGAEPTVVNKMDFDNYQPEIVIINRASGALSVPPYKVKALDGFESHRIYADAENNRIYLEGNDLRGTIYAIYTFSEKFLGVPPLHYWSSWVPDKKDEILVPSDFDIFFKSPQVRYRSILPGDQDFFDPWREKSEENENAWLETTLRLKLNTVETYSTIMPDYKLTDYAYLINKYGLVITSHHTSGLNTSFGTWDQYWKKVRNMDPPRLLLSNEKAILEFFRYNAETVQKNGIENLWTVAFRGKGDQPFWTIFEDAPEGYQERGDIINRMLQIQYDIIREVTGEDKPYVRTTFYDEIATMMAKGYVKPPEGENMIWTFVAARRDPYPYDDLVNFSPGTPVKLGYYMNFGFASTGAHVAPAEGPWKIEFNYRYVNNKSPLYFSVVNVGNMREFLLELSANAKLLWDFDSYNSDAFLLEYCTQYFGAKKAEEVAQLYRDYYDAYWQSKKPEFEGMDRQFLFQDLRYARVFDHIFEAFYFSENAINMNPLYKIGYEHVPGRTYRIDFEHNKSDNQIDALLYGMKRTIPKFELVAERCTGVMSQLDKDKQTFFNDNLRVYSLYMTHLNKTLYHYVYAYKHQRDEDTLMKNLEIAYAEAEKARDILYEAQHGIFSTWYSNADPLERTFQIEYLLDKIKLLKQKIDGRMYQFLKKSKLTIPLEVHQ
jgi:hypothetical protein